MDFLNRYLRSRNIFLSAGLHDLRCLSSNSFEFLVDSMEIISGARELRMDEFVCERNDIVVQEMKDIHSDCEDVWIKIDLFGSKSLLIGAYYKPHGHKQHSWEEFSKSLSKARKLNCNI